MQPFNNVINSDATHELPSLKCFKENTQANESLYRFISMQRDEIKRIISGEDNRLLVIIGPCSIHDPDAALEYATRLAKVQKKYRNTIKIVMRTYFEKPRTRSGWKGFIVEPNLDGEFNLEEGINRSREVLKSVLELGLATATEFLDTNIAPYIADLVCWGAIGARTTESQPHRQLASGLNCPIGFKNGTDGNTNISIDAIHAAKDNHLLLLPGENGQSLVVETSGNPNCHIILRGGLTPNYSSPHVKSASYHLEHSHLNPRLVVDCSHGNSGKKAQNQLMVAENLAHQIVSGEINIAGVMCESFLVAGNQKAESRPLTYGQSVTDECLNWDDSIELLDTLNAAVQEHRSLYLESKIA